MLFFFQSCFVFSSLVLSMLWSLVFSGLLGTPCFSLCPWLRLQCRSFVTHHTRGKIDMINHILNGEPRREHGNACGGVGGGGRSTSHAHTRKRRKTQNTANTRISRVRTIDLITLQQLAYHRYAQSALTYVYVILRPSNMYVIARKTRVFPIKIVQKKPILVGTDLENPKNWGVSRVFDSNIYMTT
jgi:hypothetical protein